MNNYCGVVLVLLCQLHRQCTLAFPLQDESSLVSSNDQRPSVYYQENDLHPDFGLPENPDLSLLNSPRINDILEAYFNLLGKTYSENTEDYLPAKEQQLAAAMLVLTAARQQNEEHAHGDVEDGRMKRQQGWHTQYGKRAGRIDDGRFQNSPSSSNSLERLFDSESLEEFDLRQPPLDSATDSRFASNDKDTYLNSPERNLKNTMLSSPYFNDGETKNARLDKRQQGWHITYGKRSDNGLNFLPV